MIILRNKTFSSRKLQLIRKYKKLASNVMSKVDNVGLKAGDAIVNPVKTAFTRKTPLYTPPFKFVPKSGVALNREAVQVKNNVIKKINTPIGQMVDNGLAKAIERPDVAGVVTACQFTTPVGAAIGGYGRLLMIPGYSEVLTPLVYNHPLLTKNAIKNLAKVSDKYRKTRFSQKLRSGKATISSIGKSIKGRVSNINTVPTGMVPTQSYAYA